MGYLFSFLLSLNLDSWRFPSKNRVEPGMDVPGERNAWFERSWEPELYLGWTTPALAITRVSAFPGK